MMSETTVNTALYLFVGIIILALFPYPTRFAAK